MNSRNFAIPGKPAAFLRGFRAVYLGVIMNCIILGWVNLAMVKILMLVLGIGKDQALWIVIGIIALTSFISALSGLWGVLVTDLFQFAIKMTMVIVLAVEAVRAVGGMEAMKEKLGGNGSPFLSFVPDLHSVWMPAVTTFFVYIAVNWWATWYPGAEPRRRRCYVAQRMFSTRRTSAILCSPRSEVQHRALRAASTLALGDDRDGFGDSLSAFAGPGDRLHPRDDRLSACVTAWSHGGGIRRRFYVDHRDTAQLGRQLPDQRFLPSLPASCVNLTGITSTASQVATVLLTVASAIITHYMDSIAGAWKLLIVTGAGTGAVLILRWYWWRINAWSEVSAMATAFVLFARAADRISS